jgi:MFS family permease
MTANARDGDVRFSKIIHRCDHGGLKNCHGDRRAALEILRNFQGAAEAKTETCERNALRDTDEQGHQKTILTKLSENEVGWQKGPIVKEHATNGQRAEDRPTKEQSVSIWTKNFVLLCLANLAMFLSLQLLLPTLPLYIPVIGGTQRDVGYVMAAYTLAATCMRTVTGWLLDRYGRKTITISGLTMMLAVTVLYRLAHDVSSVTVVRALHGLTFGLVGTAIGTAAADSLPTTRMAEGVGYFGLTTTLSMALAPMIGLWLVGTFSYPVLFTVVSLMTMLTLFCTVPVRSANVQISAPGTSGAGTVTGLLEKTALLPSVVVFFLSVVYGAVVYFVALYGADLGIGNIGLFFAAFSFSMVITRPMSGRWADHSGTGMVILIGLLTLFGGITAIGLSRTLGGFLLAGTLVGLGFGFCLPTLQALAVRHVPANRRGAATGTYYAAFDMGVGLGAILWGFVAEAAGYQVMYFITLIPVALAGANYYKFRRRMAVPKLS